jgi:hypothetical protein
MHIWVALAGLLALGGCAAPEKDGAQSGNDAPRMASAERKAPTASGRTQTSESSLEALREKEREQIARLDSLKRSIETDSNRLRREEAMLRNIRNRMTEAETAEQRSRQVIAARDEQVLYDANAFMDETHREPYREPAETRQQDYAMPAIQQPEPRMRISMRETPPERPEQRQPQAQNRLAPVQHQAAMPMPQQHMIMANDDIVWDPPANPFAEPYPGEQAAKPQPRIAPQNTPARPASPVQPAQPVAVEQPTLSRGSDMADDVFTPDLFLSAET